VEIDIVFFSQILHDWDIPTATKLLARAYEVLPTGGAVLVHEKLLNNERSAPSASAMVSISMLFWTEGQQFTFAKLAQMMTSVGFKDPKKIDTVGYWSVVYATK